MQFVASGQELSFEVTYDQPGLSVGMTVVALSGPSPQIVAGPTLMDNTIGSTYTAKFQPLLGQVYLVWKAVYTDDTLTTLSPSYTESSETIQVGGVDISYIVPTVC